MMPARRRTRAARLNDAAACLDELAAGRLPDQARARAGCATLEALPPEKRSWAVLEAAAKLGAFAQGENGGDADLSDSGKVRAALLAEVVRSLRP